MALFHQDTENRERLAKTSEEAHCEGESSGGSCSESKIAREKNTGEMVKCSPCGITAQSAPSTQVAKRFKYIIQ